MKWFLAKSAAVALVFLLLAAGALTYQHLLLWRPDAFSAATIDKNLLLDASRPPRVLLVGGSNLAFGVDSGRLSRELGRPVVNMGLTMGAGIPFLLAEVEGRIGPGDLVVLSPEYEILHIPCGDPSALAGLLWSRPASARFLSLSDWAAMTDEGLVLAGTALRESVRDLVRSPALKFVFLAPYRRTAFDGNGDVPVRLHMATTGVQSAGFERRSWRAVERNATRIAAFAGRCESRGAAVAFTWPPCPEGRWQELRPLLERTGREIEERLGPLVVDHPKDLVYPPGLFYDTVYHLSAEGISRRTAHLAKRLRSRLSSGPIGVIGTEGQAR
jgi:hypothetical protein